MKPQLVPVILGGRRGVRPFSPADLFTAGTVGAWYDPSDYSTLFQDSAGTTPVTAVEQPVRLMLDKSQGLVLGSELVTGAITWAFSGDTSWTQVSADTVSSTGSTNTNISVNSLLASVGTQYVQVVMTINFGVGSSGLGVRFDSINPNYGPVTSSGTYRFVGPVDTVSLNIFVYSGFIGTITVSVKVLPGNHALAPNDASRPVLRARYNLLTYSEQFDNAAWSNIATTISANSITAPDGTTTADKIIPNTTNAQHYVQGTFSSTASQYTITVYAKAGGYRWLWFNATSTGAPVNDLCWFDVLNGVTGTTQANATTSITSVGNGWYRCTCVWGAFTAGTPAIWIAISETDNQSSSWAGNGTDGIYLWGADLRTGSSAGTYQRIAAATDYATAGFLPYLYFVTDDSFGTNSINFTGTDKMSVCAGVTKLSDAAAGMLAELSASFTANAGTFYLAAPETTGASGDFSINGRGSGTVLPVLSGTILAPATRVFTALFDIAAPARTLRLNGAQIATSNAAIGTGNFGNYPLFIGRRNNATVPFEGRIYQLIVCGKTLSASELASTEAYVNSKTGAY